MSALVDTSVPAMVIAGERVLSDGSFSVENPATGAVFGSAPECSRAQLDAAFAAAREAQRPWAADPVARTAALLAAAKALAIATPALAPILVAEQGKPLKQAAEEVQGAAWWIKHHARLELETEVLRDDAEVRVEVAYRPIGVVAAITPWNFPLLLAAWKLGPALSTGNTVVLKPSPLTPLSTLTMVTVLAEHLPPGVLNVVSGGNALGGWMTAHPVPRKVSFTGSIATGRRIAAAVADDLKRLTLELGGNDAAILLDDVDIASATAKLFEYFSFNAGQTCCTVKRIYAPERIYDQVVEALAAHARAAVVGDGMDPATQIGPINNPAQLEIVTTLTDAAIRDGAVAAAGGHRLDRDGYFFAPTILSGARDGMAVVDEEQFGPVLPVIPYRNLDDAIDATNGTEHGLDASVWSADTDRAAALAGRLECGTVWINAHQELAPSIPFGGSKQSGLGVENGRWGMESFVEPQVIYRSRA